MSVREKRGQYPFRFKKRVLTPFLRQLPDVVVQRAEQAQQQRSEHEQRQRHLPGDQEREADVGRGLDDAAQEALVIREGAEQPLRLGVQHVDEVAGVAGEFPSTRVRIQLHNRDSFFMRID